MLEDYGFDIILPSHLVFNDEVEDKAKFLYGVIRQLSNKWGYCFASNDYLAKKMNCGTRAIQYWLASLKKHGYVQYKIERSNGFNIQRHIYLGEKFKKNLPNAKRCANDTQSHASRHAKSCVHNKDKNKEDKKEEEREGGMGGQAPSPPTKFPKSSKKQIGETVEMFESGNVLMPKKKYIELLEQYGTAMIEDFVYRLQEYSEKFPKKFRAYGSHAAVIRSWIRNEQKETAKKPTPTIPNDKNLADRILLRYPEQSSHIHVGHDYLEFVLGQRCEHLKFGVHGFKEQAINLLRKMNLDVSKLEELA